LVALIPGLLAGFAVFLVSGNTDMVETGREIWDWMTPVDSNVGRLSLAAAGGTIAFGVCLLFIRSTLGLAPLGRRIHSWSLMPTVLAAVSVGLLLVWVSYSTIEHALHPAGGTPPTRIDVLKTALTAVAGVGAAVALVVAYRRQRDVEQGRFIERFGAAAAQLGDADPAVRIAGVYAMTTAADEATTTGRRQQCIDVLCGYLRLPYSPKTGASDVTEVVTKQGHLDADEAQSSQEVTTHRKVRQNDRVVRTTVVNVIAAHLRESAENSWSTCNFNFSGVHFEDASFRKAAFLGAADFEDAVFAGDIDFSGATFGRGALFENARFAGCALFTDTLFNGHTDFSSTRFKKIVDFRRAQFDFKSVFDKAKFTGVGIFLNARFGGETTFAGTSFDGHVFFREAQFTGRTDFRKALFRGTADFSTGYFSNGLTSFRQAEFLNGTAFFTEPRIWSSLHVTFDWDQDIALIPESVFPQPPDWPPRVQSETK
jgi:uncharacterized protein YjbI with pentapeptide repeats